MNDNSVCHLVTVFVLGRQSTRVRLREVLAAHTFLMFFFNDLNIFYNDVPALFKYADDSTIIAPVSSNSDPSHRLVELFLNWSKENNMICNTSKCKELVVRKMYNNTQYEQICNIPECNSLSLIGVTLYKVTASSMNM